VRNWVLQYFLGDKICPFSYQEKVEDAPVVQGGDEFLNM
jgi:hypothetical protein